MDIEIALDTCCETPNQIVADTFSELAEIIMEDESLHVPNSPQDALELYFELLHCIDKI